MVELSLSLASKLSPLFTLSLFSTSSSSSSARVIPNIPSLSELRKRAEHIGTSLSDNASAFRKEDRLPLYSAPIPLKDNNGRGVQIPSNPTRENPSPGSWFHTSSPPPAYTKSNIIHTHTVNPTPTRAKLQKNKNKSRGYNQIQTQRGIPGENGISMQGRKTYAQSVISQPTVSDMQYDQEDNSTWWEWLTCRA